MFTTLISKFSLCIFWKVHSVPEMSSILEFSIKNERKTCAPVNNGIGYQISRWWSVQLILPVVSSGNWYKMYTTIFRGGKRVTWQNILDTTCKMTKNSNFSHAYKPLSHHTWCRDYSNLEYGSFFEKCCQQTPLYEKSAIFSTLWCLLISIPGECS